MGTESSYMLFIVVKLIEFRLHEICIIKASAVVCVGRNLCRSDSMVNRELLCVYKTLSDKL